MAGLANVPAQLQEARWPICLQCKHLQLELCPDRRHLQRYGACLSYTLHEDMDHFSLKV
jgi:hypothetical protein